MYRVLKFDRWLSFVFAHKDPEFWHLIIDTAENCGFEYIGAVSQKNGQTSFKKRQNPFTVLSGELIINFKKVRNPRAIMKANIGIAIEHLLIETVESIIAKYGGATIEQINDEMIIRALENGRLDELKKYNTGIDEILREKYLFDKEKQVFTLLPTKNFSVYIPIEERIRFYLNNYFAKIERERQNNIATFDELVLNILPSLKNGKTPEEQTILNILRTLAVSVGENGWQLKKDNQGKLF